MKILKKLIPLLVLFVGTSAFAQFRIATIDLNRVFTNYWKTRQAQVAIDERRSDIEKTDKDMLATFNKAKEEYQKMLDSVNDPAVSSEEKDKRKKAAEDKLRDLKEQDENIQQFERGSRSQLEDQYNRTRFNIVSDIRTAVSAKAKNDGYTLVVDTAAQTINATPVVLYCAPGDNDITESIIKQINVGAPVDTPKSEGKPASESPPKK